jgi:transposase-like protein
MATQEAVDKRPRVTPEERARIVELIEAGEHGCNEIARIVGRNQATVSKIASEEGLHFERGQTRAATAAKQADSQARLAKLAEDLLDDIERMRQQLWAPCTVYSFGGKENTYNEHDLDEPDFRAKQSIMTSIGIGTDKVLAIRKAEAGPGEAVALIIDLVSSIRDPQ